MSQCLTLYTNHAAEPHEHDGAVYLHILDGRMGLGIDIGGGMVTVSLAPGSTIEVPAGCRHTEQLGAEGVRLLVSRR